MIGIIYALRCPLSGAIRYVGRTIQEPGRRLSAHLRDCTKYKHHSATWLNNLKDRGLKPSLEILEKTENLAARECFWIEQFRSPLLTNAAPGGHGGSNKGRQISLEHRQKLREAARRQWTNPQVRKIQVEAIRNATKNPNFGQKIRESKLGNPRSYETVISMSRGMGGRPFVDQHGNRYETVNGCARQLGLSATEVSRVLRGKAKHTHGYIFRHTRSA